MKKTASILVVLGLLTGASSAAAAKSTTYVGKTSSGHKITFKLRGNKIVNPEAGIGVTCLPIQGGGSPRTGADYMYPLIKIKLGTKKKFKTEQTPAFYFRNVLVNQEFTSRKGRNGRITGKLRMQYSFLVSKYPIGTFNVYSCLGTATYKARRRGSAQSSSQVCCMVPRSCIPSCTSGASPALRKPCGVSGGITITVPGPASICSSPRV